MKLNAAIIKSAKAIRKEMLKTGSQIVVVAYYRDRTLSIHSPDSKGDIVNGLKKLLRYPMAHCIEDQTKTPHNRTHESISNS